MQLFIRKSLLPFVSKQLEIARTTYEAVETMEKNNEHYSGIVFIGYRDLLAAGIALPELIGIFFNNAKLEVLPVDIIVYGYEEGLDKLKGNGISYEDLLALGVSMILREPYSKFDFQVCWLLVL